MNTKEVGLIGESLAIYKFTKLGIPVYLPLGENTRADLVIDIDGKLLKCQVKTTEKIVNNKKFIIKLQMTRANKNTNKSLCYSLNDIDYFILVCLENDFVGMLSVEDAPKTQININLLPTKSINQHKSWSLEDIDIFSCVETLRDASKA
jgi:hypothetical protein